MHRNISGRQRINAGWTDETGEGAFRANTAYIKFTEGKSIQYMAPYLNMETNRVVPSGTENVPINMGVNAMIRIA